MFPFSRHRSFGHRETTGGDARPRLVDPVGVKSGRVESGDAAIAGRERSNGEIPPGGMRRFPLRAAEGLLERRIYKGGSGVTPYGAIPVTLAWSGLAWSGLAIPAANIISTCNEMRAHVFSTLCISFFYLSLCLMQSIKSIFRSTPDRDTTLFVPQFHFYVAVKNIPVNRLFVFIQVERSLSFNAIILNGMTKVFIMPDVRLG